MPLQSSTGFVSFAHSGSSNHDGLTLHSCTSSSSLYQTYASPVQLLRQANMSADNHDSLDRICQMDSQEASKEVSSIVLAYQLSKAACSSQSSSPKTSLTPSSSARPSVVSPQYVYRTNKRPAKKSTSGAKKSIWSKLKVSMP